MYVFTVIIFIKKIIRPDKKIIRPLIFKLIKSDHHFLAKERSPRKWISVCNVRRNLFYLCKKEDEQLPFMYFFHLIVLCLGDDVDFSLDSFHLQSLSSFQLGNLGLNSLVLLICCDNLVGELLPDDVCDVITLFVAFVQQLNPTATNNPHSHFNQGWKKIMILKKSENQIFHLYEIFFKKILFSCFSVYIML